MRWQEMTGRLSGFGSAVFGLTWTPPDSARNAARRLLAALENRKVLYGLQEYETPAASVRSVSALRRFLTNELRAGPVEPELAKHLTAMCGACLAFRDTVKNAGGIAERPDNYPCSSEHWAFVAALGALRKDIGYRIAMLSAAFGVDIDDKLSPIVPPPVDRAADVNVPVRRDYPQHSLFGTVEVLGNIVGPVLEPGSWEAESGPAK